MQQTWLDAVKIGLLKQFVWTELSERKGTLIFQGIEIKNIPVNKIFHTTIEAYGHIDDKGSCQGTSFNIPEGSFTSSVYIANLEIFTTNNTLSYNVNNNMVTLEDLTECDISDSFCLSLSLGYVFHTLSSNTDCERNEVDTLFSGKFTQFGQSILTY